MSPAFVSSSCVPGPRCSVGTAVGSFGSQSEIVSGFSANASAAEPVMRIGTGRPSMRSRSERQVPGSCAGCAGSESPGIPNSAIATGAKVLWLWYVVVVGVESIDAIVTSMRFPVIAGKCTVTSSTLFRCACTASAGIGTLRTRPSTDSCSIVGRECTWSATIFRFMWSNVIGCATW